MGSLIGLGLISILDTNKLLGKSTRNNLGDDLQCIDSSCSTINKCTAWFTKHIATVHNSKNKVISTVTAFSLSKDLLSSSSLSGSSGQQSVFPLADDFAMNIDPKPLSVQKTIPPLSLQSHPYHHPAHSIATKSLNMATPQRLSVKSINDFSKLGLQIIDLDFLGIHPPPALLICIDCQHGITPKKALNHIKMHNITIANQDKLSFASTIETSMCVGYKPNLAFPSKLSPPIPGLKVNKGWSCTLCNYCSTNEGTFRQHFSKFHSDKVGSHASYTKIVHAQQYFQHMPSFEVTPTLANLETGNLYELYLKQFTPTLTTNHLLPPAISTNEVTPLLRVTQWHEHLKDFIDTCPKVQCIMSLVKLPTSNNGDQDLGKPLDILIEKYLKSIRVLANTSSIGVRCLLMECPR